VTYFEGNDGCVPFNPAPPQTHSIFTGGCVTRQKWSEIIDFASSTGAKLVMGLNAQKGRGKNTGWNSTNARQLIEATHDMGTAAIFGYELGNEQGIPADDFARCYNELHSILKDVYRNSDLPVPKLMGTDDISLNLGFFKAFLPQVPFLHAITWHAYPLGPGYGNPELDAKVMNATQHLEFFDLAKQGAAMMHDTGTPNTEIWMGETGGCYNSG
jgi:hypothetical protein